MPNKKKNNSKTVEAIRHDNATRKNIPTAEYQSVMREAEKDAIRVAYERRNWELASAFAVFVAFVIFVDERCTFLEKVLTL